MPWAVAAAAVAAGGSIHAGNSAAGAAGDAADASNLANKQARDYIEAGTNRARDRLQPYADQEAIGRNQMMRQLGLIPSNTYAQPGGAQMGQQVPGAGGNVVAGPGYQMGGGGGTGYGEVPLGDPIDQTTFDDASQRQFGGFVEQLLQRNITAAYGSGYHRTKGVQQGSRRTLEQLKQLQDEGRIPAHIQLPNEDQVRQIGGDLVRTAGGHNAFIKRQTDGEGLFSFDGQRGRPLADDAALTALADDMGIVQGFGQSQFESQYGQQPGQPGGAIGPNGGAPIPTGDGRYAPGGQQRLQPGPAGTAPAPGAQPGYTMGNPGGMQDGMAPQGGAAPGAPGYTGSGASGVPVAGGVQTQFTGGPGSPGATMGGVENISSVQNRAGVTAPTQDFQQRYYQDIESPTPQFGMDYQNNPAYQAMIEETMGNVNQYAANAGGLYSGRRGEALREASAATQMNFQRDLADREQRAYEGGLSRRGAAVGGLQGREDLYYTNYMNLLQNLSQPTTATNIANIDIGQAGTLGANTIAAQNQANSYNLMGQQAQGAATADAARAIGQGIATATEG